MKSARLLVAAVSALAGILPAAAQAFDSARVVKADGYLSFDRVAPGSSFRAAVQVRIEPGWHVNAHEPSFEYLIGTLLVIQPERAEGVTLGKPLYPKHVERSFSFTQGKALRVYEGTVSIGIEGKASRDLPPGARTLRGHVRVQACDDRSCLAPARLAVQIPMTIAAPGEPINAINGAIFSALQFDGGAFPVQDAGGSTQESAYNTIGRYVEEMGWAGALVMILLGGLTLNLTPCVYPLIPITLAYFGGQASGRPARTFRLAALYVLGMCLTYSMLGVVAATTGSILGSALQSPVALVFLSAVMVGLALSMFGLFELQVPLALRRFVTSRPGSWGALLMGLTVGLVAAPCVGPFVVSLLAFVGQAGSPLLGFWLFFVLAMGLGLPYLVLGGFAGSASGLPRAGAWMEWVKKVFGCIMIAMAFYFLDPLLSDALSFWAIPVWLAASGAYLGFVEGSPVRGWLFRGARLAAAGACAAVAAALLMASTAPDAGVVWQPYTEEALDRALATGRPVIIEFTAEWCLPCKELEHFTFRDPRVMEEARGFSTLRADITSTLTVPVEALKNKYEVLGAPTILFLDPSGREAKDLRLTGFEKAPQFLERMRRARLG